MEKYLMFFLAALILSASACKNESEKVESQVIVTPEEPATLEEEAVLDATSCYRYASSKDTIVLQLDRMDKEVTGKLSYNYLEKPKSEGTFKGEIVGDTIFANYTFNSEGKTETRELIFVKKDSSLVEGFGETEVQNGKTRFKPDAIMSFNEVMSLVRIECP